MHCDPKCADQVYHIAPLLNLRPKNVQFVLIIVPFTKKKNKEN
jgi:hypothetical protein